VYSLIFVSVKPTDVNTTSKIT